MSTIQAVLWKTDKLALLLAVSFAASMWFYVERIFIPHQIAYEAAHGSPRGNLSDLFPRWLGARELLLHGRDPYSEEITREIQVGHYGRVLDSSRSQDPKDQAAFAYPVYVVFLLAPFIHFPFSAVEVAFLWVLSGLTCVSVLLWLQTIRWRPPATTIIVLILLTMGSFPAVQGLKRQQLSLLVSALIAGCLALLASKRLAAAGVLLALASIKPQLALPISGWLMLWAISDWRQRQRFVWGYVATMAALLGGAEYVLPGWIPRFYHGVIAYRRYTGGAGSLLDVLTTPLIGRILAVLLILTTVVVCVRSRATSASSTFAFTVALVLTVTVVIIPMAAPYNQVLLLPAIFLLVREPNTFLPKGNLRAKAIWSISTVMVLWPWLAAAGMSLASFMLPAELVQRAWVAPLVTSFAIPLAVIILFIPKVAAILRQTWQEGMGTKLP